MFRSTAIFTAVAFSAIIGSRPALAQSWAGNKENEDAIAALYDAAKKSGEKEIVIYGAYSITFKPVWEMFSKRFPEFSVVGTPISGSAMISKISAEIVANRRACDIVMSGTPDIAYVADTQITDPFLPPNAKASLKPEYYDPAGKWVLNYAGFVGVLYNVNKLKPEELPKTLKDLLDPRFKGMVVDDPLSSRLTAISWTALLRQGAIDAEWIKAIKPNLKVVPTTAPYFANVTTGSLAMLPFNTFNRYLELKRTGAPVGFVLTPGVVVPSVNGMAIIKDAPNRNAARLLVTWFLTPEAQNAIGPLASTYPMIEGAKVPEDWPPFSDITKAVAPTLPPNYKVEQEAMEKIVRPIYQ